MDMNNYVVLYQTSMVSLVQTTITDKETFNEKWTGELPNFALLLAQTYIYIYVIHHMDGSGGQSGVKTANGSWVGV